MPSRSHFWIIVDFIGRRCSAGIPLGRGSSPQVRQDIAHVRLERGCPWDRTILGRASIGVLLHRGLVFLYGFQLFILRGHITTTANGCFTFILALLTLVTFLRLLDLVHSLPCHTKIPAKRGDDLEQFVRLHLRIFTLTKVLQQARELLLRGVHPLPKLRYLPNGAQRKHPNLGGSQQRHLVLERHGFNAEVVRVDVLRRALGLDW
mmetsp:Transcript_13469/g.24378  ORF Transcript_13469/g.24378 Transcript_13469/m.24378 type:complete len:206 (-) Transcript_13469:916-1533(-)